MTEGRVELAVDGKDSGAAELRLRRGAVGLVEEDQGAEKEKSENRKFSKPTASSEFSGTPPLSR